MTLTRSSGAAIAAGTASSGTALLDAFVASSGADDAYAAKLNGRSLRNAGSWNSPDIQDLGPEYFAVGENRLTGVYWNQGGPGGLYFQLEMLMADGSIRPAWAFSWGTPPTARSRICIQVFTAPLTVAHQAPLFTEFPRQEYWSG